MQRNRHLFVALAATFLLACGPPPNETGPPDAAAPEPNPPDPGPPIHVAAPPALTVTGTKHLRLWLVAHAVAFNRQAEQAAAVEARPEPEPEPVARPASPPPPVVSGGSVNGYPCGGDLPPCWVLDRESGGNPLAENPTSTASGLWQFLDSTWAGYGGYGHASHAPVSVQNERARQVWAGGAGCSAWSAC